MRDIGLIYKLTKKINQDVARARDTNGSIAGDSNLPITTRDEHITVLKVASYQM